jgi:hypothetical protein
VDRRDAAGLESTDDSDNYHSLTSEQTRPATEVLLDLHQLETRPTPPA